MQCTLAATLICLGAVTVANAGVSPWVDILVEDGALTIASEVAGIPGRSLIDSGSNVNAINATFVDAHNLSFDTRRRTTITGVHGKEERRTYTVVPVTLMNSDINVRGVVEVNWSDPEIQLLLGSAFLKQMVFQFDYPNQRMRAFTRDAVNLKALKNVDSKSDPDSGIPMVKVRFNDTDSAWLLLDTGNTGGVLLDRQYAQSRGWLDKHQSVSMTMSGANADGRIDAFNIPAMHFGPFELESPLIMVPGEGESLGMFEPTQQAFSRLRINTNRYQGILGYDVLQHFLLTIDYKKGHVHVDLPEELPPEPAREQTAAEES